MVTKKGRCRSGRRLPLSARPLPSLPWGGLDLILLEDAVPDLHSELGPGGGIDSPGLETTEVRKGSGQVLSGLGIQLHPVNAHSNLTVLPLDRKSLGPSPEIHLLPICQSVPDIDERVIRLGQEGIVHLLGVETPELHLPHPRGELRQHVRRGGHSGLVDLHLTSRGRLPAISVVILAETIFLPSGSDLLAEPPRPLLRRGSALQLASQALAEPLDVVPAQTLGDGGRDRLGGVLGGQSHRDEVGGDLDPLIEKGHGSLSTSRAGDLSRELRHLARADASLNELCDLAFRNSESYGFERLVPDERLRLGREIGSLESP